MIKQYCKTCGVYLKCTGSEGLPGRDYKVFFDQSGHENHDIITYW